ncbi:MAG TPA: LodA/GoxA family CTQ-dependent oxidase [Thermoanaerobaculia bacterium]
MSKKTVFRVHPTINFARFGTSQDFYLSPETSAGMPLPDGETTGGLPIRRGTEDQLITSGDLRDADGNLKRQAARFRLFSYDLKGKDAYPHGGGVEILPGTRLPDGRTVKSVVWTVHLANKKANNYNIVSSMGVEAFANGQVPQLRNPQVYGTPDSPARLTALVIDPGPRAIVGKAGNKEGGPVSFDQATAASYSDGKGGIAKVPQYPKSFPAGQLFQPSGPIETLGELRTDAQGRLLVLPGYGRTAAQIDEYGVPVQLVGDTNNASWFDDAADGPVSATIVFEDGGTAEAFGAWVVCCDPGYAPQIRNVVSVWDDVYDAWVRDLGLRPDLYDPSTGVYNPDYRPAFESDVRTIFRAAALQRWTVNLPPIALRAHEAVDAIGPEDNPNRTIMAGLTYIRNPNADPAESGIGVPLMPLSLGDAGKPFLTVTQTQYFFLQQWSRNRFDPGDGPPLGPGETLDMVSLSNCLGGRYVPGIEISFPIRQPDIYINDWRSSGAGPFRIKPKPLDYKTANPKKPFLSGGWIPLRQDNGGLEPGDLAKFMAIPWQTDYNSCSIHQTSINTAGANAATGNPTTLYWSWPAQRPDAVYVAGEVVDNVLPAQKWSIRGPGTFALNPKTASTFQDPLDAVGKWDLIGIVIQGTAIDGGAHAADLYLEVQGRLEGPGDPDDPVLPWPFNANPPVTNPPVRRGRSARHDR